ncbi:MAG: hypothetical protein MUE51_01965 [Thermoleophilia bacterium]|jgi:hypothetical protein|nr:hypothetical protein [Thermoleophilia bacterium]
MSARVVVPRAGAGPAGVAPGAGLVATTGGMPAGRALVDHDADRGTWADRTARAARRQRLDEATPLRVLAPVEDLVEVGTLDEAAGRITLTVPAAHPALVAWLGAPPAAAELLTTGACLVNRRTIARLIGD